MDLSAFKRDPSNDQYGGQLGGDNGTYITNESFCKLDDPPVTYTNLKYRHSSFVVTFDALNQLEDSTQVGAEGSGGGSGGFSGLRHDKNDVETRALKVRFPQVDAPELEKDIRFTMVVDSGGGAIAPSLELFDQSDISALRELHKRVAVRRSQSSSYDAKAKETAVTINTEMWIVGETAGGSSVESNRMTFPLRLCGNGCGVTPRCAFTSDG